MSTPTKPERVEVQVGQRWRADEEAFTVTECPWSMNPELAFIKWDSGGTGAWELDTFAQNFTLIAPAPATPGTATVTPPGEDKDGYPLACLSCGGKLKEDDAYECDACDEDGYSKRTDDWRAGKRDFPRRAPGAATPTTLEACSNRFGCDCSKHCRFTFEDWRKAERDASKPPAPPVGPPASCLTEQWDGATATPRSALEAIQAKREPEPWVESCDLLHWLRDA